MTAMTDSTPDTITASLTPWYIRRMLILFAMFLGFTGWFAYDWQIGYPKKAAIYQEYLAYVAKGEDGLRDWARVSAERKIGFEDERTMAPFKADAGKIQEQLYATLVCAVLSLLVLVLFIRSLGTSLGISGGDLLLPRSAPVAIASIHRVDTRKWLGKGLAYIWYQSQDGTRKGVIDGMKYGGFKGEKPYLPDLILERVVEGFQGELIELQEETAAPATEPEST
jgi:hypothetical protein